MKDIVGKHPSYYQLDQVCESDTEAAKTLITDLKAYEESTGNEVGLLCVLNPEEPTMRTVAEKPAVDTYLSDFIRTVQEIKESDCSADAMVCPESSRLLPHDRLRKTMPVLLHSTTSCCGIVLPEI